jgi:hypothetical protein
MATTVAAGAEGTPLVNGSNGSFATRGAAMRRWIPWLALAVLSLLGLAVQLYSTSRGAGVSPDSTHYLAAANNLMHGHGLVTFGEEGDLVPLRLWPPAYSIILAPAAWTVERAWLWGRYLNGVLFGLNTAVVYLIIRRGLAGRWVPAAIGAALILIMPDIVEIHAWIWSEPLMILTGSLGLLFADRFIERGRTGDLLLGAVLAGIALLTRYAAGAYAAAGALGSASFSAHRLTVRRLGSATLYLALALAPVLIWAAREGDLGGDTLSRTIRVNERGMAQLGTGVYIFADWILPGRIQDPLRSQMTELVLVGWLALLGWYLLRRSRERRAQGRPASFLPELLGLFVLCYALLLVVVRMFVSPGVSISPRIFTPGLTALIPLTVMALTHALDRFTGWRTIRPIPWLLWGKRMVLGAASAFLLLIMALNASRSVSFAGKAHRDSLGYADVSWERSAILRYLEALPEDAAIVTNGPDAVHFLTGRMARMLPPWPATEIGGGNFLPGDVASIQNRVHPGDVLVFFRDLAWRPSMSEIQIKKAFALEALIGDSTASVYRVEAVNLGSVPR